LGIGSPPGQIAHINLGAHPQNPKKHHQSLHLRNPKRSQKRPENAIPRSKYTSHAVLNTFKSYTLPSVSILCHKVNKVASLFRSGH
jgi:hypothetical protein